MIEVDGLGVTQGAFRLEGVALRVPTGQYGVLMGKTGSGKTTVLEAIAGLRPIRAGRVTLGTRDVTRLPPAERNVGYVPQDGALFGHRTVRGNLAFALELRGTPRAEIDGRVRELAGWLGIDALLDRKPLGLSGGEAQRVALGRALAFAPPVLLLDEPLSSLDEDTRAQLVEWLQNLRARRAVTVLHITHARTEADALGDVRLRMENGRVVPM